MSSLRCIGLLIVVPFFLIGHGNIAQASTISLYGLNGGGGSELAPSGLDGESVELITTEYANQYYVFGGIGGPGSQTKGVYGSGGGGGNAVAKINISTSGSINSVLDVGGGEGGAGYYTGHWGGNGGSTHGEIEATSLDGSDISLRMTQYGGSGGTGASDPNQQFYAAGGSAADTVAVNAVRGHTTGALTLHQAAQVYSGGFGNPAGAAGKAVSILDFIDNTAQSIRASTEAWTASGGHSFTAPSAGADGLALTNVQSTRVGTSVYAEAHTRGGAGGCLRAGWDCVGFMPSGKMEATAKAEGIGNNTKIESYAVATSFGSLPTNATAKSEAAMTDTDENKLVTKASSSSDNTAISRSLSVSGWSSLADGGITVNGVETRSMGTIVATADQPVTLSRLNDVTGSFDVVGSGIMGGVSAGYDDLYSTQLSAEYSFADLGKGNNILFSLTESSFLGDGFQSLGFTLSANGKQLYHNEFSSLSEWTSFMSKPIDLGAMDGRASILIAMSGLYGVGEGYNMQYVFASAITGSYKGDVTQVSSVPLPAALPLFATGLVGVGFLTRRKRLSDKA